MMRERLKALCQELTESQLSSFERYYDLLVDWNTRMNLTAITEEKEVAEKHFYDSLAAAFLIPTGARCIDVGTGAGFPGVPLLIMREDITVTLLDGLNKRLVFLETVLKELGLSNRARLVHSRAEDGGRDKEHREKYDIVLTRAVAGLPTLLELTVPFLKVGGSSICYKGEANQEIAASQNACKLLGCTLSTVEVPADYGKRTLVIAKKLSPTAKIYPRKAGTPGRSPL